MYTSLEAAEAAAARGMAARRAGASAPGRPHPPPLDVPPAPPPAVLDTDTLPRPPTTLLQRRHWMGRSAAARAGEDDAAASAARVAAAARAAGAPADAAPPALARVPLATAMTAATDVPEWCALVGREEGKGSTSQDTEGASAASHNTRVWALPWVGVSLCTPAGAVRFMPVFLDAGELERAWSAAREAAREVGFTQRGEVRRQLRLRAERKVAAAMLGAGVSRTPPPTAPPPPRRGATDDPEEPPEMREFLAEMGGLDSSTAPPPRAPHFFAAAAVGAATVAVGTVAAVARAGEAIGDVVDAAVTASPLGLALLPLPAVAPAAETTVGVVTAAAAAHNASVAAAAAAHPGEAAAARAWTGIAPTSVSVACADGGGRRKPERATPAWPPPPPTGRAPSQRPTWPDVCDALLGGVASTLRATLAATVVAAVRAAVAGDGAPVTIADVVDALAGAAVTPPGGPRGARIAWPEERSAGGGSSLPPPRRATTPTLPIIPPLDAVVFWYDEAGVRHARGPPPWVGDGAAVGLMVVGDVGGDGGGGLPWPLPPLGFSDVAGLVGRVKEGGGVGQ